MMFYVLLLHQHQQQQLVDQLLLALRDNKQIHQRHRLRQHQFRRCHLRRLTKLLLSVLIQRYYQNQQKM
tara:strand:- start:1163 stop:1369 length:207 start_codon:yes stop_codon:yes gene_type:complete